MHYRFLFHYERNVISDGLRASEHSGSWRVLTFRGEAAFRQQLETNVLC